ncbi:hypothetical protein IFT98_04140 [Pseudomonas sp. CFBP 8770]|uniref:dermonecrotic toxin domain-containing protein n=1 Tax=unclassified Pseudomonas TaxID=196821 RepID=UPI0017806010|nr:MULTISPECIES: DUF6543 domain-containing protein [unclassified Pseudomonas]MBD8472723.1 hypothetical protein [Pseudomonas sp. CFBP 8773]MBD8646175.1 hypothetical protein [Pseudomonas sp. CFBP 8770]
MSTTDTALPGRHDAFIRERIPAWVTAIGTTQLNQLQRTLVSEQFTADGPQPWFTAASSEHREALLSAQALRQRCRTELGQTLAGFRSVIAFAEPILVEAIRMRFGTTLNVHATDFVRIQTREHLLGLDNDHVPQPEQLLMAALGNFVADPDFHPRTVLAPSGSVKKTGPFPQGPFTSRFEYRIDNPLPIDAGRFASLVRQLDLGRLYQTHLSEVFETTATRAAVASAVDAARRAQLRVLAHVARMKQQIDEQGFRVVEGVLEGRAERWAGGPVQCSRLTLLGCALHDVVVIGPARGAGQATAASPCLVWLPGDPHAPLRQYASSAEFVQALAADLIKPDYARSFLARIAQGERAEFQARLERRLWRSENVDRGRKIAVVNGRPNLDIVEVLVKGELFAHLHDRHVAWLKAEAKGLAVPTDRIDADQRQARWSEWLEEGVSLMNLAALFIPALGEVMAPVIAQQLISEVYHGVEAWEDGRTHEAFEHFKGIVGNLALAMVAHGVAADFGTTYRSDGVVEEMQPVRLPDNSQRLLHPDLQGYRAADLPPAVEPDGNGVYRYLGKTFIKLDDHIHEVQLNAEQTEGHLLHPSASTAYRPSVRSNGAGAWQHEFEQPLQWQGARLMRRFGTMTERLSDQDLLTLAELHAVPEDRLRRLHVEQRPMPAALHEGVVRYRAHQDVAARAPRQSAQGAVDEEDARLWASLVERQRPTASDEARVLCRDFPALPVRIANEIGAQVSDAERTRILDAQRLPLRVAEQARARLAQWRASQACSALFLETGGSADRDTLVLGLLPCLPGWTGRVRIELRSGGVAGEVTAAAGAELDSELKYIVARDGRYRAFDAHDQELGGWMDLYSAICRALPDTERAALDLTTSAGEALQQRLIGQVRADRTRVSQLLKQRQVQPWFKSPQRHAAGIGYALSGRGQPSWLQNRRLRNLYPGLSKTSLQLLRDSLVRPGESFEIALQRLEQELQVLQRELKAWRRREPAQVRREQVARDIISAWRRETTTLDLSGQPVGELPLIVADFSHVRHLRMGLMGLQSDPSFFLSVFPNLLSLDLTNNGLTSIPTQVRALTKLMTLELDENRLALAPDMFDALISHPTQTALRYLGLKRSFVTRVVAGEAVDNVLPAAAMQTLARIPHLRALDLASNALTLDDAACVALGQLRELETLRLQRNHIRLTEAGRSALAGLTRLQTLDLNGNPLGLPPVVERMLSLRNLGLSGTGIDTWPPGLTQVFNRLPQVIRIANLSSNEIVRVPVLEQSAMAQINLNLLNPGRPVLNLDNNPLSERSRQRLRRAGLFPRRRWTGGAGAPAPAVADQRWLEGCDPALAARIADDRRSEGAAAFYRIMDQVTRTAGYARHARLYKRRMWAIMEALVPPTVLVEGDGLGVVDLRQQLFDQATLIENTCGDGISVVIDDFETRVLAWQAASTAIDGGPAMLKPLSRLSRQLYKAALVDEYAVRITQARLERREALLAGDPAPPLLPYDQLGDPVLRAIAPDEVEIRLRLRELLQKRLGLRQQPETLYTEQIGSAAVEHVARAVLERATDAGLTHWLVDQPFWQLYLHKVYSARLKALSEFWAEVINHFEEALDAHGEFTDEAARLTRVLQELKTLAPDVVWQTEQGRAAKVALTEKATLDLYAVIDQARRKALDVLYRELTEAVLVGS